MKINRSYLAWTATALTLILCVAGGAFAQAATRDISPPILDGNVPLVSLEHTPSLAYNASKQRVEMAVPARGSGYFANVAYSTYSAKTGWSAPVFITNLQHDVKNVHLAATPNGATFVAFEVAESIDRVYVMRRDKTTGAWSDPVLVSAADTPSHEPQLLVVNNEVTVVFRTSTGDETQSNKLIVVGLQENIPIW